MHTVGPIVRGSLSERQRSELKSCYDACLNLAAEVGIIDSVAFCAISTGVFGFPADEAAPIAVNCVKTWLERNPGRIGKVLFNVFTEADYERYRLIIPL
jgi:O-acetyl-ADP-ribose deacetylase (regulator of RNase III)